MKPTIVLEGDPADFAAYPDLLVPAFDAAASSVKTFGVAWVDVSFTFALANGDNGLETLRIAEALMRLLVARHIIKGPGASHVRNLISYSIRSEDAPSIRIYITRLGGGDAYHA